MNESESEGELIFRAWGHLVGTICMFLFCTFGLVTRDRGWFLAFGALTVLWGAIAILAYQNEVRILTRTSLTWGVWSRKTPKIYLLEDLRQIQINVYDIGTILIFKNDRLCIAGMKDEELFLKKLREYAPDVRVKDCEGK